MSKAVKRVAAAVQRFYPKELADSSWDNTGLLVDASEQAVDAPPKVLLAIDLTAAVCSEAVKDEYNVIVAYHPFIFRGLKSISPSDPQQRSLLKLIQAGISVYSPHTAVDAARGGVNDFLADGITLQGKNEQKREFLQPVSHPKLEAGMGRYVEFKEAVTLSQLVAIVKAFLKLETVQVVCSERHKFEPIKSVALCAGSGGSVVGGTTADLVFTGELGHHEMLHLRESGKSAIVCGHSNTERGFLPALCEQLRSELGPDAKVSISAGDRDPIEYW